MSICGEPSQAIAGSRLSQFERPSSWYRSIAASNSLRPVKPRSHHARLANPKTEALHAHRTSLVLQHSVENRSRSVPCDLEHEGKATRKHEQTSGYKEKKRERGC
eukprot:6196673-Pleurochrysis_carterae.AAC.1